jgi:DNA-binding response OmpR family regulator
MKRHELGSVRILIAMENPIIRQGLQNALQSHGYSRAIEVTALDRFIATLVDSKFDLVLASTELGNESLPPFLSQLRQGALIHHPIPIIIAFLTSVENDYVRRAIDCGPDDLLQMPIVPGQLLSRLDLLAKQRKTFVVTSDYVGPDRRQAARPGTLVVPTIDVPNPMALRIAKKSDEEIDESLAGATARLRAMRLARYAFELLWLLRAIRSLFEQKSTDREKLISFCERIKVLLLGLPRLMPNGVPEKIGPMIERLDTGSNIVIRNGLSADAAVIQGLTKLITGLVGALREHLPADLADTTVTATAAS